MGRSAEFEATPDIHPFPSTPEEMRAVLEAERRLGSSGEYRRIRWSRGNVWEPLEVDNVIVTEINVFSKFDGQPHSFLNGIPSERIKYGFRLVS